MVIKYSRAERRHHSARMFKRAYHIIETEWFHSFGDNPEQIKQSANRRYNNMQMCSCHMCCNVRRSYWADSPLTLQELKAQAAAKDSFEDYYTS